jgi:lysophospholipase L1-like esterase
MKYLTILLAALTMLAVTPAAHAEGPQTQMFGDSLTWAGRDNLRQTHPHWGINGVRGREVEMLPGLVDTHLAKHGAPRTLVIALGTNEDGASKALYQDVVDSLPATTVVVFVTTYRSAKVFGAERADTMRRVSRWMNQIARSREHTCIAPWRNRVKRHPHLLADGVHATRKGERVWARMVIRHTEACQPTWHR